MLDKEAAQQKRRGVGRKRRRSRREEKKATSRRQRSLKNEGFQIFGLKTLRFGEREPGKKKVTKWKDPGRRTGPIEEFAAPGIPGNPKNKGYFVEWP